MANYKLSYTAEEIDEKLGKVDDLANNFSAVGIDFTNWVDGRFVVTNEDNTTNTGTVVFDYKGNPTSITLDGYTITLVLPEV